MEPRPLLVSNDFAPRVGGIQDYAHHIARGLSQAAAFVADHPAAAEFDPSLPYPVRRGHASFLWPTRKTERGVRAAAEATRANVLLFMAPFPLAGLGPRLGLPWAVCTHGAELAVPARTPLLRRLYRAWLGAAGCLFSVSSYTGLVLRSLVGPAGPPIRLLPPGVPLDVFRPDVDGSVVRDRFGLGEDPVLLCTGRLVPRKGQDTLIRALPGIRRRVPGTRLLIVGDGPRRRLLERAARRLPSGAVVFAGRVEQAQLPAHYAAADVFVHPNRSRFRGLEEEGFGIVFLEAQASGLPVIAGLSGGSPEAVAEDDTALLVDGRSTADVTHAAVTLLEDPGRRQRMGKAARRFVERRFRWEATVAKVEADLGTLAAGDRVSADL